MGTGRASTPCCPPALSEQSPAFPLALSRYADARFSDIVEQLWSAVSAVAVTCCHQLRQTGRFKLGARRVPSADAFRCRSGSCFLSCIPRSKLVCPVLYVCRITAFGAVLNATNEFALRA